MLEEMPAGAPLGTRNPKTLGTNSDRPDTNPGDSEAATGVVLVKQTFLPVVDGKEQALDSNPDKPRPVRIPADVADCLAQGRMAGHEYCVTCLPLVARNIGEARQGHVIDDEYPGLQLVAALPQS